MFFFPALLFPLFRQIEDNFSMVGKQLFGRVGVVAQLAQYYRKCGANKTIYLVLTRGK